MLAGFALVMVVESTERFLHPVPIVFNQAILVAVAGFIVNGVSMLVLGGHHESHDHGDHHLHGHGHAPDEDHNLRSAYLHVLADALTSLLAIVALLAGKYFGTVWLDPVMGVLGAGLVIRWAWGLLRQSGRVLLDQQAPASVLQAITEALEHGGTTRITDLHVWSIGPGYYAVAVALETVDPRNPDHYRTLLPAELGLAHVTVEVSVPADRRAGGADRLSAG